MPTHFWPFDVKGIYQENEQLLATVFESTTDPFVIYDQDYRIIRVNPAFTTLYELSARNLVGRYCYEAIYNRRLSCEGCHVEEVFRTGMPMTWEERRIMPDGLIRHFEVYASPVRNLKGATTLAFWQKRDITEQKNRENQLKKSEIRFKTIFETTREGVFILNDEAQVIYTNNRLAELLGRLPEEITGSSIFDFIDKDAPAKAEIDRDIEGLLDVQTISFRKKDGGQFPVRMAVSLLEGNIIPGNAVGVVTDITPLINLEEKCRAIKECNEKIINSSTDSIIVIDPNTYRIVQANEYFLARRSVEPSIALQKTCYEIIFGRGSPCELYGIQCPVRETALKNRSTIVNRVYRDGEGNQRNLLIETYPLHDKQGKVNLVVRRERDVTYQKKLEEVASSSRYNLEKARNQLQTLYDISEHLAEKKTIIELIDNIVNIIKNIFSDSECFFFILNAERKHFLPLEKCCSTLSEPVRHIYAKLEESGLLATFAIYLNTIKPAATICIGKNTLPPELSIITEEYHSWVGIPICMEKQCAGYFLLASNSSQGYTRENLQFLYFFISQIAGPVRNRVLHEEEIIELNGQVPVRRSFGQIIGQSKVMQEVYDLIKNIADSDATVLIMGENGTGKELVAEAIHQLGNRCHGPFVIANCSAFSSTLLESELFGHEKGAFTGAVNLKRGRIERANEGTLFLDEIGNISLETQILLLRFLQNHCFERVGGEHGIQVNVRVMAATNCDLHQEVLASRFRSDFYYRLNVININLPPLRKRKEDIPLLSHYFLEKYAVTESKEINNIAPEIMQILMDYDWPGNIRQLENAIHHAVILSQNAAINKSNLPRFLIERSDGQTPDSLAENERHLIIRILQECNWNKHEAARRLNVSRSTLYSKIQRHQLMKEKVYEI